MAQPLHAAFKDAFKHGWQGPVDLRLAYSWCGPPGARLLADVLPQCQVLRSLDVEKCILGFEGSAALAPALAKCTTLETLSTAECLIRSEGVQRLAMALQSCHALTSLDMSKNQMGSSGIDILASCLQQCPNLAHLKLGSNGLGEEGCTHIARHFQLPYYSALVSLDLSNNDVGDRGAVMVGLALDAIVSTRSGLVQLILAYNQLSSAVSAPPASTDSSITLHMEKPWLEPSRNPSLREYITQTWVDRNRLRSEVAENDACQTGF